MFAGDLGFRTFKLDTTNIRAWDPDWENLSQTLLDSVEHLKTDRSESDVLYELLLKLGLDLCVPMEQKTIAGKTVHSIGAGTLIVCLALQIGREEVESLTLGIVKWHKVMAPAGESTVVFRDGAFTDDVAKTNLAAILQQHGLGKEGVYKSLQITEEHFRALYANTPFEYFLYDSSKLGQVRNFSTSPHIQIMVVTVGAINKKDVNNLYKDSEKTGGENPST